MTFTMQDAQIAKFLLEIKAVKFNVKEPFLWTSGIRSPVYCDNRIINSKVEVRNAVVEAFIEIINNKNLNQNDIIGGVATGGVSYGAIIASKLSLPFIYIREERKQHGLMKTVEGAYEKGDRVVVIEDHISTGGSSMKAIKFLKDEDLKVLCLLSIMTYGFKSAAELFRSENVKHESICNLDTVLDVALQQGIITSREIETILQFRESPKEWQP